MLRDQFQPALAGRYLIERELGRGGMATVYLARDVKHERTVALKVLHPDLAAALGAERFLAEIRTTASLQHPHILPLHDSGEAAGFLFYVMPFVEGETLRARLEREGLLPIDDALRIACELLGALDYAHRHGVVHRDVKPENILLHDGSALVADFGIALAVTAAGGQRMTQTGLSLGTPQYMSPEQAMGERVLDGRADVYAAGAVLYEMLTGEPPFTGATVQSIVAKVMTERPTPPSTVRDTVSPRVEAAVLRALAKLPADRFATAKEFADALQADDRAAHSLQTRGGHRPTGSWRRAMVPFLAGLGLGSLAALAIGWRGAQRRADATAVSFRVDVRATQRIAADPVGVSVAVSPDGKTIAYISRGDSARTLLVRRVGDLEVRPFGGVSELQTVIDPMFSPDGRWLGIVLPGSSVLRVPATGGPPTVVADIGQFGRKGYEYSGYAFAGEGFVIVRAGSLWHVAAPLDRPQRIAAPDSAHGEWRFHQPFVLPEGQRVLFTVSAVGEERSADRLAMVDLDGGNRLTFDLRVSNLLGVADGWLFYGTAAGAIDAVRFDARAGPRGEPVRLLDGLLWLPQGGVIASLSPAGTLAYVRGTRERELLLLDARGVERGRVPKRAALEYPAWSPDGRRLALAADGSIWEFDVAGGTLARVTSRADALRPVWWPDGRRLAYIDDRTSEVWTVDPDGTAPEALLYRPVGEGRAREVTFTPDGRSIVIRYDSGTSARARDIYIVPLGGGSAVPLVASSAIEAQPVVSPDGRWLAYVSDETGRYDVYVRAMAGGRRLLVSTGGAEPRWEDSTTLVYRSRGGQPAFWRAHLRIASGAVEVATRERLFDDTFDISVNGAANYDVSPTGVFAVIRQTGESPELIAVTNWLAQSRAALAGKR